MTRILHIAGNSGAGKSVIALNLAVALAQQGKDVLLADTNLYSPDIASYLKAVSGFYLNDFIHGERNINDIISHHPSGIRLITAQPEEKHEEWKHNQINKAILHLMGKAEIVLLDSFSHNPVFYSHIDNADETLFVTNDDYPSIVKSKDFIQKMDGRGMHVIGVVMNRKHVSEKKHVESILQRPVLAELRHDTKVIESVNAGKPVVLRHPSCPFSQSVTELARLLS